MGLIVGDVCVLEPNSVHTVVSAEGVARALAILLGILALAEVRPRGGVGNRPST